ncbi:MAG TPA: hypothetical protein PLB49_02365 [Chitinophagaceae bacterium]|nr:hypothetical protein [Chitinophagaceae bacterium]HPH30659.1 hypothetical protein [Chitinophagaceae bacterium]
MTKNLLTGLGHILYYKNPKALEALEAPLPKDKINSLFSELGFFDEDLYALYSWKNGCAFGKLVNPVFIFSTTILKLEEVVKYKKRYPDDELNFEDLLLIFANEEEGLLFNSSKGNDYGKIHLYSVPLLSIDKPVPYYDSLQSMLQTTITMYKENALELDVKTSFLDVDIEKSIEIYDRYNPKCRYYSIE